MPHSAILNVMTKAAYRAGRSLKRDLGEVENLQVSLKGPRNFVTAADRRAEEIVREELAKARPDYGFLGEEGGARAGADKSHRWIVDPLDGTTNFLHGIPHFAVSIALERNGAVVAALTYNPANDELYVAERGKGAFLNDRRIRVAARQRLADAVVACGLPHYGRGDLALGRHEIAAAQQNYAGLRRFGAATLDLAWVAAGRFDAYWERDLSPWDMAAGILLVREAGGFVSDLDGGDAILSKGSIAAGNDTMHRELLRLLKEAGKAAAKDSSQESNKESSQDQSKDAPKDTTKDATKDGPDVVAASPSGRDGQ
jgi:myo-inositol-1(or 4)-monophosphatase